MQNPALSSSLLDHSYPSAELLGAAVFQGQGPPRVTVVPWKVSEQASLLLFILRVCNFTSRGQCRSRQCHTAHPSGRNLAQEGVLLASLTGKEDRGQRVRAAGQTGTVWGSQGEGSLLPPKCSSSSPVSSSLKPGDQKATYPVIPPRAAHCQEVIRAKLREEGGGAF